MAFEQKVKRVDEEIVRGYLDLVVNSYRPLFEKVRARATEHMSSEEIHEIDLGVHSGLVFREDGHFYAESENVSKIVELRDLPEIYQQQSNYIAGCADSPHHVTPSIHRAMSSALSNFREKVKSSLSDVF